MKIIVTGGSGFIGTNVVDYYVSKGWEVLSLDNNHPQKKEHIKYYKKADLLNFEDLKNSISGFNPDYVIHLGARTDLNGKSIKEYAVNFKGTENLMNALNLCTSVKRCIFTSTKLVAMTGYTQRDYFDYKPDTLYGESKVSGEKILFSSDVNYEWCIGRPSSIWGPWFGVPYKNFFVTVGKGRYFNFLKKQSPKSFGYVGNVVAQIDALFSAPKDLIHRKIFYWSDYERFTISDWANCISKSIRNRNISSVPFCIIKMASLAGDFLKKCGYKNPPLSTFRLNNIMADTTNIPIEPMKAIIPDLPVTMEQGVNETVKWLKEKKLI